MINFIVLGSLGVLGWLVFGNKSSSAVVQGPSPGDSVPPPMSPSAPITVVSENPSDGTLLLSNGSTVSKAAWIQEKRRAM